MILTFMSSERKQFYTHLSHPSPNKLPVHTHKAFICIHTQLKTNFLRAYESLDNKSGDIFRRRTLLFPSLTIHFLWPEGNAIL
jgi:hypothetical protein